MLAVSASACFSAIQRAVLATAQAKSFISMPWKLARVTLTWSSPVPSMSNEICPSLESSMSTRFSSLRRHW
ncbi:MAG: hypothetical protein E7Z98_07870 [Olsenella sp.]|nr:hypothetical protein [Olsenella sp.]